MLICSSEITILIDPIFKNSFFFKRFSENISIKNLPKIDIILYSHNHPDHYNTDDLKEILAVNPNLKILAPLQFNVFLKKEIPSFSNIFTFTWWQQYSINNTIIFTILPAIHWSQSNMFDRNETLWCSWMISISGHNIYFSGDTAYGEHFQQIKKEFNTIHVACIPIAPYTPRAIQIDSHVDTEQSYQIFLDLGNPIFIPIHWGTFAYGDEFLKEPIEKILLIMKKKNYIEKLQGTIINQSFIYNL